ncbi:scoloptoxin SSD14 isoform X6 [Hydra vulgaris]|uniref:Scoloptoxin SSD14 isoform X6 n=1 Tax=Hydra vulgaris TaxID=6087 RepID=A0ABM4DIU5_HYDVU
MLLEIVLSIIQILRLFTSTAECKVNYPDGWIHSKQPTFTNDPFKFKEYSVAADSQLCSKIGAEVIKKGGNAADAVVTSHCCTEVVNSQSTGLGGGGNIVYYDKPTKTAWSYDFRETVPLRYSQNRDSYSNMPGDKVLVPGVLKGLYTLWKDFGSKNISWSELWKPCIDLATDGIQVGAALNNAILKKIEYFDAPGMLSSTFKPGGNILRFNDTLKRLTLARTYSRIAQSGNDEDFYRGAMAYDIVLDIQEAGGTITLEDLYHYKVRISKPTKVEIKGLFMHSSPPPGGGSLVSLALKIIDFFNWTAADRLANPGLIYHYIIEALKFSYAPNTFIQDPFFEMYSNQVSSYMLDPEVAFEKKRRIDMTSHKSSYYMPYNIALHPEPGGTTHISIIDKSGNAVSCTSSLNGNFGSGFMSSRLGIIYNDHMKDFYKTWRSVYNINDDKKFPGKRPMSRLSPIIFIDSNSDVVGVFGAAGGPFIPTALIQVIINWLYFGDNIKESISLSRLHCQLFPKKIIVEKTFPDSLIQKIQFYQKERFTNSTASSSSLQEVPDDIMGVVQAIVRLKDGTLNAHCDYRKDGQPAGE